MTNNILLVDDEIIILKTIADKLEDEGLHVTTASNGQEGLDKFRVNNINLVITDLMMEGMNGIDMLKGIKTQAPETSVIILTGYGDLTSSIDAMRLGVDDYLLKPCDLNELVFRINQCLEKQSLRKKVKMYENILPICLDCKKIRDDSDTAPGKGKWIPVDEYLTKKAGKSISHGYCPECGSKFLDYINKNYTKKVT